MHKKVEAARSQLEELRETSGLELLSHMTFETFMPEGLGLTPDKQRQLRKAYEACLAFAQNPDGWLVLKGGYGCGKTHLAAAIANERLTHGGAVLFVVAPDLLDYLRAAYAPTSATTYDERFETIRTTPLLIMDDFGAQSSTAWAQEKMFQILNYRYNARLATAVTTNRELEEIDPRLRSRLTDLSLSRIVHITAPDFRQGQDRSSSELSSLSLYADMTFRTFNPRPDGLKEQELDNLRRALAGARKYAAAPEGWLVLRGDYGVGKTHLAAAIANYRVEQGETALFVVVPDLLDHLRSAFAPNSTVSFDRRFEEIRTTPFLILDDLGTQNATPWAQEKLFQIINHRYAARLPTVFTIPEPDAFVDERIETRLNDRSRSLVIEISVPSYRESHARAVERQAGRNVEGRRPRSKRP